MRFVPFTRTQSGDVEYMREIGSFVRRAGRFVAGSAFWLHALMILPIPRAPIDEAAHRLGLTFSEAVLATFFVAMAMLSCYGFRRFLVDSLYVYAFPFILSYKLIVNAIKVVSQLPKVAARFVPGIRPRVTWMVIVREMLPDASIAPTLTQGQASSNTSTPAAIATALALPKSYKRRETGLKTWLWTKLGLPIRSLTIAWCLLILLSNKERLVVLGLVILGCHTIAFIIGLGTRLARVRKLLAEWESEIVTYASGLVSIIMNAPEGALGNPDVSSASSILALLRGAAFLAMNRVEVSYSFFVLGCFMYAVIYLRISLLFGFLYLGMAKINHLPLGFLDSMANSVAMPLSYTNFPRHWLIQAVEDVHSIVVVLLGFGALREYLRNKTEAFRGLAEEIWEKLDEPTLRTKMAQSSRLWRTGSQHRTPNATRSDQVA